MKFRLLVGKHIGLDMYGEEQLAKFDSDTKAMTLSDRQCESRNRERSELKKKLCRVWTAPRTSKEPPAIIETSTDLEAKFNGKGAGTRKFERLQDNASPTSPLAWEPARETLEAFKQRVASFQSPAAASQPISGPSDNNFQSMTVQELRAYADAEEIDLQGATRRDDILKVLRSLSLAGGAV